MKPVSCFLSKPPLFLLVVSSLLFAGCFKKNLPQEECLRLQTQLHAVTTEHDRLLMDFKTDRSKLESEIASRSQCETRLEQYPKKQTSFLVTGEKQTPEKRTTNGLECACPKASLLHTHSQKDLSLKNTQPAYGAFSQFSSSFTKLFQAEEQLESKQSIWDAARILVTKMQKALETSEKAMQKQQRAFRKAEHLFLQLDPTSTHYQKEQKNYADHSQKFRDSSEKHMDIVRQFGEARKQEEEARKIYLSSVQEMKTLIHPLKAQFSQSSSPSVNLPK